MKLTRGAVGEVLISGHGQQCCRSGFNWKHTRRLFENCEFRVTCFQSSRMRSAPKVNRFSANV